LSYKYLRFSLVQKTALNGRSQELLEKYGVEQCCFGHLHNVKHAALPFGKARGMTYSLVAADYIDFCPIKLY